MPWYANLLIALLVIIGPFIAGGYLARKFRMPDYGWRIGLVLFSLFAGLAVMISGWPPGLGIDLSGGVILVYEVDPAALKGSDGREKDVDMDKLKESIMLRLNPGGHREITIREYGDKQIEIIIPRADESELRRIKSVITDLGTLEFRILANHNDDQDLITRALASPDKTIYDPGGESLGWWVPVAKGEEDDFRNGDKSKIAVRTTEDAEGKPVVEVLVVNDIYNVDGGYLDSASAGYDRRGRDCVEFVFDSDGAKRFGHLTGTHLPNEVTDFSYRLGIILNGSLYSAPNIQSTITNRGEITGNFTKKQVDDLVRVLNAGALPTALTRQPISELLTGPTLGKDTIQKGAVAIALSLILVLAFMIVYYRFAGLVACFALLVNLILILAIIITIHAELTLPGLAGLVLTVGMAVDANVLIYERIREELDRNAALRMAIRNGFARATTTIVDANLTTLITATVLYVIGTDQVRGFAVTLWLGVVLSMYTAIFCARVIFDVGERQRWIKKLSMMRMLGGTDIDFLGVRRLCIGASLVAIVIGLVAVWYRGAGLLDIDFTGGVSVEVVFDEPQKIGEIREALGPKLSDLAVTDVEISGEEKGVRFMINTSQQEPVDPETGRPKVNPATGQPYTAVEWVEEILQGEYKGKLRTNEMTIESVALIPGTAPSDEEEEPAAPTRPASPEPTKQGRSDLPPDSMLALADPSLMFLAQAEKPADKPAPKPTEEKPGDKPAAKTTEKPAEKPAEEKPADKPATKPAEEKPADKPAEEKPATKPAEEKPAAKPTTPAVKPQPAKAPAGGEMIADADLFAGGSVATLKFAEKIDHDSLEQFIKEQIGESERLTYSITTTGYTAGSSTTFDTWTVKLRMPPEKAKGVFEKIQQKLANQPFFPSSSAIGGKVAGNTRTQAIVALMASLLFIIGYIWVRFQKVMYGLAAVVALVHDVLITLGAIAITVWVANFLGFLLIDEFKIGLPVLAAFLTIIGYSLNDTIIVFDRIREVKGKSPVLTDAMVNTSVNQTLSRTLITSGTTLLVVLVLYIGGGQGIHAFAFSLLVGVGVGTYSSIYIASPVLLWMTGSHASPEAGK